MKVELARLKTGDLAGGDLFCEPSPAPAKFALSRLGRCRPTLRLPLVEMTDAGKAIVTAALADCGIA